MELAAARRRACRAADAQASPGPGRRGGGRGSGAGAGEARRAAERAAQALMRREPRLLNVLPAHIMCVCVCAGLFQKLKKWNNWRKIRIQP